MQSTKVKVVMTHNPSVIAPDSSLKRAAQEMEAVNCGILPVGTEGKLEGIITDRDIVIRAVAKGKNINTEKVRDYMTPEIYYCKEDDALEQAAELMHRHHISRLLVQDESGNLSGIISFGCILRKDNDAVEVCDIVERAVGKKAV